MSIASFVWITLDFTGLFITAIGCTALYIFLWIRILSNLGTKGWLILLCWLILHMFFVRFVYSWNRNDFEIALIFICLSLALTASIAFLRPESIQFTWLKWLLIFVVGLLVIFLSLEKNARVFMHYRMMTRNEFEYPPYKICRSQVNWTKFFKDNDDRKWIQKALSCFFADGVGDDKFRDALFDSWSTYNAHYQKNKILFNSNGIFNPGDWQLGAIQLCADRQFLPWWAQRAKANKEMELAFIDFLTALNANIIENREELRFHTELRSDLLTSFAMVKNTLETNTFVTLRKTLLELEKTVMTEFAKELELPTE